MCENSFEMVCYFIYTVCDHVCEKQAKVLSSKYEENVYQSLILSINLTMILIFAILNTEKY